MPTSATFLFRVFVSANGPSVPMGGSIASMAPAAVAISCNMGFRMVILGDLIGDDVASQANILAYVLPFRAITVA